MSKYKIEWNSLQSRHLRRALDMAWRKRQPYMTIGHFINRWTSRSAATAFD